MIKLISLFRIKHHTLRFVVGVLWICCSIKAYSAQAEYRQCVRCHEEQVLSWQESHHHDAMQAATKHTVLADFSAQKLSFNNVTYSLEYGVASDTHTVTTVNSIGKVERFTVRYTFGVDPLQQYLVEVPGGKLQALQIAWDSRPASKGGQRWFHLLPKDMIDHRDRLHWTGPLFNWNAMCADCHSSGLVRNFDSTSNQFDTRWNEINVSCQSCHSDLNEHLKHVQKNLSNATDTSAKPLAHRDLKSERSKYTGTWEHNDVSHTAKLVSNQSGRSVDQIKQLRQNEISLCAACHSRRSPLTDGFTANQSFLDVFEPSLLTEPLYYHDGQIKDEVYVYGSFLQSKMFHEGVTCSDCHESHSLELKVQGNGLCFQCHKASVFDQTKHHKHLSGSEGSQCINCHMPKKNYMLVDPRRDHSFRIPLPELSQQLGVPNACNQCHTDKDLSWSVEHMKSWYGDSTAYRAAEHYGLAFQALSEKQAHALQELEKQLQRNDLSDIVRASLLAKLSLVPTPQTASWLIEGLKHSNPLVVLGALKGFHTFPPAQYKAAVIPLLNAEFKALRIEAVRLLSALPLAERKLLDPLAYKRAKRELLKAGEQSGSRGEGLANNGHFLINEGEINSAIETYQNITRNDPTFVPAYINLADLYRQQGQDDKAQSLLESALELMPENSDLNHTYGLALVRSAQHKQALSFLYKAAEAAPKNARYQYVYAVALNNLGKTEAAQQHLLRALKFHRNDRSLLSYALQLSLSQAQFTVALQYAERLLVLNPNDLKIQALVQQLKAKDMGLENH